MILTNQQTELICPTGAEVPSDISQVTDLTGQQYTLEQLSDYAGSFHAELSRKPSDIPFPESGPSILFQDWSAPLEENEPEFTVPCLMNHWIYMGVYLQPSMPALSLPFYMTAVSSFGAAGFLWSTVYFPIPSLDSPFSAPFPISVFIPMSVITGMIC
ncbi:hypothetical protein AALB39_21685 [Lachnospiraceae bacterium 54-53]